MKYGAIANINKPVSRIVLGTMIISTDNFDRSVDILDAAMRNGINTLDSANVYYGGQSERAIGRWMEMRGNREDVVIATKGAIPNADRKRVTPFDITADIYDSLARLRTDYIDIYMLHRDDPEYPIGPIVEILNEHKNAGRIHAFGGSNWTHQRLQEANDYAAANNLTPFTVSSPNFGLAEQVEDPWGPGCVTVSGPQNVEARAWYKQHDMPIFAYSSLGRGFFSGRITRNNFEEIKDTIDGACRTAYCHEVNFKRLDRVEEMAKQKGMTVAEIATAYIFSQPLNVYALIGTENEAEMKSAITASETTLTTDEMAWLNLEK
jgi:aryl-alcohol dehydrogenase-like predicted oxidoreductase